MDVTKLAPVAKAVVAIAGALLVTAKVLTDGTLTMDDLQLIVAAWATAYAVWRVPNSDRTTL